MKCDVLIVTGRDGNLGSGHFQRMATLLWRLREKFCVRACMFVQPNEGGCPPELVQWLVGTIEPAGIIVRDMRDSTEDEIRDLQKKGKVCVIDDRGAGRLRADIRVDLLPHFEKAHDAVRGSFVYGYNFIKNLEELADEIVEKSTDVAIYGGFSGEARDFLMTIIPDNCSYYLLGGARPVSGVKGGKERPKEGNYARILCASKVAISHFGIFLYEAHASLCHVVSVNPTEYHSAISDCAKDDLNLINFGIRGAFDTEMAKKELQKRIQNPRCNAVESGKVRDRALESVDRFVEHLLGFL